MRACKSRGALAEVLNALQERVDQRLLLDPGAVEAVLPGDVAQDGVALPEAEVAVLVDRALPEGPGGLPGLALWCDGGMEARGLEIHSSLQPRGARRRRDAGMTRGE